MRPVSLRSPLSFTLLLIVGMLLAALIVSPALAQDIEATPEPTITIINQIPPEILDELPSQGDTVTMGTVLLISFLVFVFGGAFVALCLFLYFKLPPWAQAGVRASRDVVVAAVDEGTDAIVRRAEATPDEYDDEIVRRIDMAVDGLIIRLFDRIDEEAMIRRASAASKPLPDWLQGNAGGSISSPPEPK